MANRDVVVVGASMGGVEALPRFVAQLPADLPAAVLVVLHIAPHSRNYLAERLNTSGPLIAAPAVNGEKLQRGRIYVALPDQHLMIEDSQIRLATGPRESHARPSIDVLFRSAAYYGGPRTIGVILTGQLDDGTAGLWAIKDRGGTAIVQSPDEAPYPSMPQSALRHVAVDHTLRLHEMGAVLSRLTREPIRALEYPMTNNRLELETRIAREDDALRLGIRGIGNPSFNVCPDCGGSMVLIEEGSIRRYRCHTGHAFSHLALAHASAQRIEQTLWSALAQLEEYELLMKEAERDDPASRAETAARGAELRQLIDQARDLALKSIRLPSPENE